MAILNRTIRLNRTTDSTLKCPKLFDSGTPLLGTHPSEKVGQIYKCESIPQNLSYKIKNQEKTYMSIFKETAEVPWWSHG